MRGVTANGAGGRRGAGRRLRAAPLRRGGGKEGGGAVSASGGDALLKPSTLLLDRSLRADRGFLRVFKSFSSFSLSF